MNHAKLQYLLGELEAELRLAQQWSTQQISPEDLVSSEPFAIDKLSFSQWLQFVFVPRLQIVCDSRNPLTVSCSVAPMAEEFYRLNRIDADAIIDQLASIDQLITSA